MKRTLLLLGAGTLLLALPEARGQSIGPATLNAAGGSGTVGGNIFDWSIGEMALVSTATGPGIIVTQGLLQNNETSREGLSNVMLASQLHVFPNPASTLVNLQFTAPAAGTLSYRMLNMLGQSVVTRSMPVNAGAVAQQIDLTTFAAAIYMLEVAYKAGNADETTTSYKIEKLK